MVRALLITCGLAGGIVAVTATAAIDEPFTSRPLDPQQTQRPTEVVIPLDNPGSHPKIGVQTFSATGLAAVREAAETITEVLTADLEFEREFYMIPRKASASIPAGATPQSLPFPQWTQIGADYVMMGSVRDNGGKLEVEVRLIAVKSNPPGRQEFGQVYGGCSLTAVRFCAHSIADDIHKQKRNLDGVARTRITFTSDRIAESVANRMGQEGKAKEIHLMDYDGAQPRRVTNFKAISISPTWGPDGRTLAYASFLAGPQDIYLTMLDGRPATRPARGTETVHNMMPAISPDGTKIVYVSNRGGQTGYYDLWVVNRDGSNPMNLTPGTPKSTEGAPAWSPNGLQIAFTSDRTGPNQIFIMNADGTNVRRVTFAEKADRPAWSSLNYIAYTIERAGKDIAIYDVARNESRILTDGNGASEQPTVAPNGRHIAFVTNRWGGRQIATIDYPDGKYIRQLTNAANNTFPNWSPTPGGK